MTFITSPEGIVSVSNSTNTALAANATFTGTSEDVQRYSSVMVSVVSNVASASNGLQIQFSHNGNNWDFLTSMDYISGQSFYQVFDVVARFFRIVFVNGTTLQTSFRLQTILRPVASTSSMTTSSSSSLVAQSGTVNTFSRTRISDLSIQFDICHIFDKNPFHVAEKITGTATSTHNQSTSSVLMSVTAPSSSVVRQSRMRAYYQPGKSLLVSLTGILNNGGSNVTGVSSRMGLYDIYNGYYLQYNNGIVSFIRRSSSTGSLVETIVSQNAWNLDKMNGTGTSGINLDFSKVVFMFIDLQSFCVGSVQMGFYFNSQMVYAHTFDVSGTATDSSITKLSLPIRFELIASNASTAGGSMRMISGSVASEGETPNSFSSSGFQFTAQRVTNPVSLTNNTLFRPVMAIMLRPNETSGSFRRFTETIVRINDFDISTNSNFGQNVILVRIVVFRGVANPTALLNPNGSTNPSWVIVDANNSSCQVDFSANSTAVDFTQGVAVFSSITKWSVKTYDSNITDCTIYLGSDIDGNSDICVFFALSPNDQTVYTNLNWLEMR